MDIVTWNIGNQYTEQGQAIAACEVDGTIYFVDASRNLQGSFAASADPLQNIAAQVRTHYVDGTDYEPSCPYSRLLREAI